jgi:hypothetical protein
MTTLLEPPVVSAGLGILIMKPPRIRTESGGIESGGFWASTVDGASPSTVAKSASEAERRSQGLVASIFMDGASKSGWSREEIGCGSPCARF